MVVVVAFWALFRLGVLLFSDCVHELVVSFAYDGDFRLVAQGGDVF